MKTLKPKVTEPHRLRVLRLERGMTQKQLADRISCPLRTIQEIELGKIPLLRSLAEIIQAGTGVDAAWLLEGQIQRLQRPGPISRKDTEPEIEERTLNCTTL